MGRRTYCRPCSRFSASPAGHATLLPWACAAAAYTAPCTWPGHAGGGGGCSASKAAYVLERSCSTGARVPDHAWMACRGSWFSPRGAERRVGQSSGEYRSGRGRGLGLARVSTGGTMCMPRGRGRRPRPVARSQTREDHTTTPRWRARARIVLFSRDPRRAEATRWVATRACVGVGGARWKAARLQAARGWGRGRLECAVTRISTRERSQGPPSNVTLACIYVRDHSNPRFFW